MTGNPINVPTYFKSSLYYKNELILEDCLKLYDSIVDIYDSEVELCNALFKLIYQFYLEHHEEYLKRTERINCLFTYKDMELFNKLPAKSRSDKLI